MTTNLASHKTNDGRHCKASHVPAERYPSGSHILRQMFEYVIQTKHKQLTACTGKGSLSIAFVSQYGGFLLVTFVYSGIFNILIFWLWLWGRSVLGLACWIVFVCFSRLPADGTLVPKHVGSDTYQDLDFVIRILLYCIECICWSVCWMLHSEFGCVSLFQGHPLEPLSLKCL